MQYSKADFYYKFCWNPNTEFINVMIDANLLQCFHGYVALFLFPRTKHDFLTKYKLILILSVAYKLHLSRNLLYDKYFNEILLRYSNH